MKISAELRAWRNVDLALNSRGDFTQQEAADFLGVPLKTYIDWEQGRRGPVGIALRVVQKRITLRPGTAGRRLARAAKTKTPRRLFTRRPAAAGSQQEKGNQ
jgi:hypothetical protein